MAEVQNVSLSVESGPMQRPKTGVTAQISDPFLAIIQSMVAQMEENAEGQEGLVDLGLLFGGLAEGNEENTNILENLFANNQENDVDYDSLMELFAVFNAQNPNFDFKTLDLTGETVDIAQEVVAEQIEQNPVNASGIDVSKLQKVEKNEKFDLELTEETQVNQNNISFEFTKVTTKSDDFKSQMELFSSFTNKSFDIRNVADENDSENQVLNLAMMQAEANEIRDLMLDRAMPTTKVAENPEIFNQIKTGIIENAETLEVGASEFVMKLSPEELGDVTIKLVHEAGKATLQIIASSETASRLINDDLAVLRDVFRPMQIEVQNAQVVTETQESQMQGFDMQNQQFNQNQQNQSQNEFVYYGNNNKNEEIIEEQEVVLDDPNNLSIYV